MVTVTLTGQNGFETYSARIIAHIPIGCHDGDGVVVVTCEQALRMQVKLVFSANNHQSRGYTQICESLQIYSINADPVVILV